MNDTPAGIRKSTEVPAEQEAMRASARRRGAMAFPVAWVQNDWFAPTPATYVASSARLGKGVFAFRDRVQRNPNAGCMRRAVPSGNQGCENAASIFCIWIVGIRPGETLQQHHEFIATESRATVSQPRNVSIRRLATPSAAGRPSWLHRASFTSLKQRRSMKKPCPSRWARCDSDLRAGHRTAPGWAGRRAGRTGAMRRRSCS